MPDARSHPHPWPVAAAAAPAVCGGGDGGGDGTAVAAAAAAAAPDAVRGGLPRFFAPDLPSSEGGVVAVGGGELWHMAKVLRLTVGDRVELFDARGALVEAKILSMDKTTTELAAIGSSIRVPWAGPKWSVGVACGTLKGGRADWLVEKCTELGAAALVPLLTERSPRAAESRIDRWQRVALAAAKQCQRLHGLDISEPVISRDGSLDGAALEAFDSEARLPEAGIDNVVVTIRCAPRARRRRRRRWLSSAELRRRPRRRQKHAAQPPLRHVLPRDGRLRRQAGAALSLCPLAFTPGWPLQPLLIVFLPALLHSSSCPIASSSPRCRMPSPPDSASTRCRRPTTVAVWLGLAAGISPPTVVCDIEGTDHSGVARCAASTGQLSSLLLCRQLPARSLPCGCGRRLLLGGGGPDLTLHRCRECRGRLFAGRRGVREAEALFALAVSDIVIVNMYSKRIILVLSGPPVSAGRPCLRFIGTGSMPPRWCHNLGREQAANRPVLTTAASSAEASAGAGEQVLLRRFTPHNITLLSCHPDKAKVRRQHRSLLCLLEPALQTPMEMLEPIMSGDIQKVSPKQPPGQLSSSAQLLLQELPAPALLATRGFSLVLPDCRLQSTMLQIRDSVVKPDPYAAVRLSKFFNVSSLRTRHFRLKLCLLPPRAEQPRLTCTLAHPPQVEVTALSNFDKKEELFKEQMVIGRNGRLDDAALEAFVSAARLPEAGLDYAVSTLLNHLFGKSFREMDASAGRPAPRSPSARWLPHLAGIDSRSRLYHEPHASARPPPLLFSPVPFLSPHYWTPPPADGAPARLKSPTTLGLGLAAAVSPPTLGIVIEGTDSSDRGEVSSLLLCRQLPARSLPCGCRPRLQPYTIPFAAGWWAGRTCRLVGAASAMAGSLQDTVFEKQSTRLALPVSDVVIINMLVPPARVVEMFHAGHFRAVWASGLPTPRLLALRRNPLFAQCRPNELTLPSHAAPAAAARWCFRVGCKQASTKRLLKTISQRPMPHPAANLTTDASGADADAGAGVQVMLRQLMPRKTTLLFCATGHRSLRHLLTPTLRVPLPSTPVVRAWPVSDNACQPVQTPLEMLDLILLQPPEASWTPVIICAAAFASCPRPRCSPQWLSSLALPDYRLRSTTPQIWDSVVKPEQYAAVPPSNFFNLSSPLTRHFRLTLCLLPARAEQPRLTCTPVEVTALANFKHEEELFKEQELRAWFRTATAPGGLAGDQKNVVAGKMWCDNCNNRDLDMPTHKLGWRSSSSPEAMSHFIDKVLSGTWMSTTSIACTGHLGRQASLLTGLSCCHAGDGGNSAEWRDLDEAAKARAVDGFGRQASAMLEHCLEGTLSRAAIYDAPWQVAAAALTLLSRYDAEAAYQYEEVRRRKRELLVSEIGKLKQPAYTAMVAHHRTAVLVASKEALDRQLATENDVPFAEAANTETRAAVERFDAKMDDVHVSLLDWDSAKPRRELLRDLDAHVTAVRSQRPASTAKEAERAQAHALHRKASCFAPESWSSLSWWQKGLSNAPPPPLLADAAAATGCGAGKSTLLNHLFGTSQTTQGVWLGLAAGIRPPTLVCDIEGTDGRERGEDDTAFEKQSALFALAVSDIVIVNMWCHDIGREQAANKPLLKTVFQVMLRLFTPRKTTLLFVIRDKTKTPMETLEPILREDIQKIWDNIAKPSQYAAVPLSDFFNVEVTALANFEEKEELFKAQVMELRDRFMNSVVPGGLAGDRRGVVPASAFSLSAQEMWRIIRENRDLDLPAHKVMVATVRCEDIAREQLQGLRNQQEWRDLDEAVTARAVDGFGRQASVMLEHCIEGYDAEAAYFDEGVRSSKRELLLSEIGKLMQPAYTATVAHHRTAALIFFKEALDRRLAAESDVPFAEAANATMRAAVEEFDAKLDDVHVSILGWDTAKPREKLLRDLEAHVATLRLQRLAAITKEAEVNLERAILDPAGTLLDAGTSDTWPALRELLSRETQIAERSLVKSVEGYKVEEGEAAQMAATLVAAGRTCIERRAREEAKQALIRMKDRFNMVFSRDAESMPRVWKGDEDIRAITRDARAAALRLLAVVAAVRLNEEQPDTIEPSLLSLLSDTRDSTSTDTAAAPSSSYLTSSTWEAMREEDVLLSPGQCRILWRQLKAETEYTISQAMAAQEASRRKAMWLPPPWAMVAMFVLGFNEFCAALAFLWDFAFNPIMWFVAAAVILLGRALLKQIDLRAEFRHGLVPGLLSVSAKVVPAMLNVLKRLAEVSEERLHLNGPTHESPVAASELTSSMGAVLDNPLAAGQGPLDAALRRRPSPVQASMVTT
eukprot:SM000027S09694  [mRNA]  locus=s27:791318:812741:+ [translate_table: standard]